MLVREHNLKFVGFSLAVCVITAFYCLTHALKNSMQSAQKYCPTMDGRAPYKGEPTQSRRSALLNLGKHALAVGVVSLEGTTPAQALFEDIVKKGGCPTYNEVKGASVADFQLDKYMGVWYELAYHDWTQYSICGCTRFNMTRRASTIEDMFTTQCPRSIGQTYAVNMSMAINPSAPGQFLEKAFYTDWPNMVLDVWNEGQHGGENDNLVLYGKAIQMQCVQVMGRRAFVGINFLSRSPITSDTELNEMWQRAEALGISKYGGNRMEMELVDHQNCKYPRTTDEGVIMRTERAGLGAVLGVKILDQSLLVKPPNT